jgi:biopolymer transport protein ExbD
MRLSRPKRIEEDEIEMSSMIDIVFQLLIFFMVGSNFSTPEKKMVTDLPRTGQPPKDQKKIELIKVYLKFAEGRSGIQITCNDEPLGEDWGALFGMMKQLAEIDSEVPVVIDAEKSMPFGYVVKAMDTSKQANLTQIAFSAGKSEKLNE